MRHPEGAGSLSFFVGEVDHEQRAQQIRRLPAPVTHRPVHAVWYDGQTSQVVLRISNHGELPVSDLDLALEVHLHSSAASGITHGVASVVTRLNPFAVFALQPVFAANSVQKQNAYYSEEELLAEQRLQREAQHSDRPSATQSLHPSRTPSKPPSASHTRHPSDGTAGVVPNPSEAPPSSSPPPSATRGAFDFAHRANHAVADDGHPPGKRVDNAAPAAPATPAAVNVLSFSWSSADVQESLPLLPGQHVDVAVRLRATEEWSETCTHLCSRSAWETDADCAPT